MPLRGFWIGTFSQTVPGPVDSADTLDGQGGPRSRSKPLQEKEFRATYCVSVHCWNCPRLSALAEKVPVDCWRAGIRSVQIRPELGFRSGPVPLGENATDWRRAPW